MVNYLEWLKMCISWPWSLTIGFCIYIYILYNNLYFLYYDIKYTLAVKSVWTVRFLMFFKEVSFAHQAYINLIHITAEK